MEGAKLENNMLKLPEKIVKRLRGKRIEISEVKEGVLLRTKSNPISDSEVS